MNRCDYCGKHYPRQPHDTRCPEFATLNRLENDIVAVIRAQAFIPLTARHAIARQLIADGWRPR